MNKTASQAVVEFDAMLKKLPFLLDYWDFQKMRYDAERLKEDLGGWSHGEQIMASFAVAVWSGKNELGFDIIEAASVLEADWREIVLEWFSRPFWP